MRPRRSSRSCRRRRRRGQGRGQVPLARGTGLPERRGQAHRARGTGLIAHRTQPKRKFTTMKTYLKTHFWQLTAFAVLALLAAAGVMPTEAAALPLMALSVNSTGIPLFAGVEDLDDMFMATMEELDKEVMDEVSIAHPFWEYLQQNNLFEYVDEIGTHIRGSLRRFKNGTVKWVTGYDDADNTPSQLLGEARTPYGHLHGVQMYNREELVKNSGKQQLIDLVERSE